MKGALGSIVNGGVAGGSWHHEGVTAVMRRLLVGTLLMSGCVSTGPHPRALQYVDDELVYSRPPASAGYEAYIRARIALEREPPQLVDAAAEIEVALRYDAREPHLWTTKAEIAAAAGDREAARTAAERALALQPGYGPAEAVLAEVREPKAVADVGEVPPNGSLIR